MNVVWARNAVEQLDEIRAFIAEANPVRAEAFVEKISIRAGALSEFPIRGRIVPELSDPAIRELLVDRYRIVYRCERGRIVILTVFEGHRTLRPDEIL